MHFPPCFRFPPLFSKKFWTFWKISQISLFPKKFLTFFFSHRPQISDFPPILPVLQHFPPDSRKFIISPLFPKFSPLFKKIQQLFKYFTCIFFPPTLTMMHVLDAPVCLISRARQKVGRHVLLLGLFQVEATLLHDK